MCPASPLEWIWVFLPVLQRLLGHLERPAENFRSLRVLVKEGMEEPQKMGMRDTETAQTRGPRSQPSASLSPRRNFPAPAHHAAAQVVPRPRVQQPPAVQEFIEGITQSCFAGACLAGRVEYRLMQQGREVARHWVETVAAGLDADVRVAVQQFETGWAEVQNDTFKLIAASEREGGLEPRLLRRYPRAHPLILLQLLTRGVPQ